MKQILVILAVIIYAVCLQSCGGSATAETAENTTTAVAKKGAAVTSSAVQNVGGIAIPTFENKALNEFANKYASYLDKYEDAYKQMKSGNSAAFTSLSQEGQELGQLATKFSSGMSESDAAKYSDYMLKVNKKLQSIATNN